MGELSPWHWLIVLLLFAVLFGAKRLPDAARGLGKSLRIFKAEMSAAAQETAPPSQAAPPSEAGPPAVTPPAGPTQPATAQQPAEQA